ncbi:MAG: PAS domain S-box protein [Pyrinomonadaceae bacterium]|nr:PAS domain S-box protein [Phycisphaerales bacterium]
MQDSAHSPVKNPDTRKDAGVGNVLPPLLRVLPDAIFRMRRDGTYLDCSVPEGPSTIVPTAEFLGRRVTDVLPQAHAAMCMSSLETACRTTTPQQFEYSVGVEPLMRHYEVRVIPIGGDEALVIVRNVSSRKQEEAESRRWGQKLALYFRQTAVGMIEWDADQRVVEWNPGAQRIFGYAREHAIGKLGSELVVPPESRAHVNELWADLLSGRGGTRSDNENMTADGRRIFCEWFNTPLADEHGRVIGVASMVQDAADRTVSQRELQRSREQHAQLVNTIEGIVWEADAKTRQFTFMSKQVEWILGVPAPKWLGDPTVWESRIHRDDLARVREYSDSFLSLKQDYQYEFRIYDADGSIVWLRNYVTVVAETDEPVRLRGIMVDVTKIKTAEEALQASEARFRRVVESNLIGLFFWEASGAISEANGAFLDMLGYRAVDPASGRLNWRDLTPPEFRQADENALAEMRRTGHCKPFAKEFIRADGVRISVLLGAAWLDDSRQQGVAYVLDITERKRAEQWQSLMMAELDHRVKNNMAAVLTLTEQSLRSMQHPRDLASSLLGRLRSLARAHGELATTHWQGARLLPLTQRTLEAFRHTELANILIEGEDVFLPPRVATVLNMALHELGTNALKYGALSVPGGVVHVMWVCHISPEGKRSLRLRWMEQNGPRVEPPTRRGFGRELIEGGVRYECAGTVTMSFEPEGVICEFNIPLTDPEMPPVIVKHGLFPPMRL